MKKINLLAIILVAVMCLTMAFAAMSASGEAVSTNVALEKPVQAGNGYKPTNVTDGSTDGYFDAGYWTAAPGGEPFGTAGNCYVEIDLGQEYAINECTNPVRTVTATVRVRNRYNTMASVKTVNPVAKDKMMEVMTALRNTKVEAPVKIGDVILTDICGSDIVVTKAVD